ncbi:hypothetical protein E4U39_001111 [Claviceps sp. Clav50 group G5]|nr:hypothetical protein E4U39_001111 [Claviceps sp. Clav50 group G5]
MAFKMDNLTESDVDDVRDRGNGAGKGKAQMQPAGESGVDPLGLRRAYGVEDRHCPDRDY